MRFLLLLLTLPACSLGQPPCDGLEIRNGDEMDLRLIELGYGEYTMDTGSADGPRRTFADSESWEAQVELWGTDGGLSPDFDNEVVFSNAWTFGGCNESYEYKAWRWDEILNVRAEHKTKRASCDASIPQIDLVVVERGGAIYPGWCE